MPGESDRRAAVIDLGSNAVRLAVLELTAEGLLDLVHWDRRGVRVIEGQDAGGGYIQEQASERTLAALSELAATSRAMGFEPAAVATSAVREARNRGEFVRAAESRAGLRLRVLDGREEAYYAYVAVAASLPLEDALIAEVGGGSLQLVEMTGRAFGRHVSLPLGAVRMVERTLRSDPPTPDEMRALRSELERGLAPVTGWPSLGGASRCDAPGVAGTGGDALGVAGSRRDAPSLVGIGGAIRDVARFHIAAAMPGVAPDAKLLHGHEVPREALAAARALLASTSIAERVDRLGLPPDRADVAIAAVELLDVLSERSGGSSIIASLYGIREGIAYELLGVGVTPVASPARDRIE